MTLDNYCKERISIEVIKTLIAKFSDFPDEDTANRNAPFHEAFLKAFEKKFGDKQINVPVLISLSSWLQGLNTRLGQSFFERVAHILCDGEKREYTSKKLGNLHITQKQKDTATKIITDLSNADSQPNLTSENTLLFQVDKSNPIKAIDFSVDVFFERDDNIIAVELKSVQPNSGELKGEKEKILEGKAALYRLFPDKQIHFYLGFPFDPTVNPDSEPVTSCNKVRFSRPIVNFNKYFDPKEVLLANNLWNFLSEKSDTMESILEIINIISTTSFLEKYQLINDCSLRQTTEYAKQLLEWNLFSELKLVEGHLLIQNIIAKDRRLQRLYRKIPFDNQGNYQWERFNALKQLLDDMDKTK
jgi:hypothetical protein